MHPFLAINKQTGTSLSVQWLRLCSANAGGVGSIPGQGSRSHVGQYIYIYLHSAAKDPTGWNED